MLLHIAGKPSASLPSFSQVHTTQVHVHVKSARTCNYTCYCTLSNIWNTSKIHKIVMMSLTSEAAEELYEASAMVF